VLGGGSNVLIDDAGVAGAVLMPRGAYSESVRVSGDRVVAGSALALSVLLSTCAEAGLSGLESLAGIPGTVGGAVVGNAGGRHGDIGSVVAAVVGCRRSGETELRSGDEAGFTYRGSKLRDLLVMEIEIELQSGSKEKIRRRMAEIVGERRRRQPWGARSAGCVFRNPPGQSAGELLDRAGLKGRRVGGAEVSSVHANFIVNRDGATSADVLELAQLGRERVKELFGVELELEIQLWPEREF